MPMVKPASVFFTNATIKTNALFYLVKKTFPEEPISDLSRQPQFFFTHDLFKAIVLSHPMSRCDLT